MNIKNYKLFLESKDDIDSICQKYGITNYTINSNGTVDVDGDVNFSNYSDLVEFPLCFNKVNGNFECENTQITTLKGSPRWVNGSFFCSNNKLITLEGGPTRIRVDFDCSHNELKTLEGGPETVSGYYFCNSNQLVNFKGLPEDFDCIIYSLHNPVSKLLENIPNSKQNKFIYWCNEYDAIKDDGTVIPERMEEVYNKLGMVYED